MMQFTVDHYPQFRAVALRARSSQDIEPSSLSGSADGIVHLIRPLGPVHVCSLGASPDAVHYLIGLLLPRGVNAEAGGLPSGFALRGHNGFPAIVILPAAPRPHYQPPPLPGLSRVSSPLGGDYGSLLGRSAVASQIIFNRSSIVAGLNRVSVHRPHGHRG